MGGTVDFFVTDLPERGRRAVGLWSSGESVEALVDALCQAEETTDDEEEKSLLRRTAGAIGSASRDIMVDVVAAVVARQSGIGWTAARELLTPQRKARPVVATASRIGQSNATACILDARV